MAHLLDTLTNCRRSTAVLFAALIVVAIGYTDFLSGYEAQLGPFYLLPISLVAWRMGVGPGMLTASACIAANLLTDVAAGLPGERLHIEVWNAAATTVFFGFCVATLVSLRDKLAAETLAARIDHLTGIANVAGFYEIARRELARCARYGRPFTVAVIDCDHFKDLNDTLGHSVGDQCLRTIGQTLATETRSTDIVARLGGDEFALVLPETAEAPSRCGIERVRERLLGEMRRHGWPVTFSVGAVTYEKPTGTIEDMLRDADRSLYSAKRAGRNQLHQDNRPPEPAAAPTAA